MYRRLLFVLGLLIAAPASYGQTPTVQYDTWPAVANAVVNTGSSAVAGTLIGNTSGTTYPTGPDDGTLVAPLTAAHFNDGTGGGGNLGTGIQSNQALSSVIGSDGAFTMGAWVNLDDQNGDNMVFGTDAGAPMHLGFRNDQAYFGFWGNDSGSAGGVAPVGSWHYFTWVFDPSTGGQLIYRDGVNISNSGGHAAYANSGNLTVGTNGGNGGDLNGAIDDARVYNTAFSAAQVTALYQDSSRPDAVPEPSTCVLAGLGLIGLVAMYRRRRAA